MKVGFIGLGIMGSRMAANLIKAGYDLVVYNRTAEKAKKLEQLGAEVANSPKEAASKSDVLFTMLANPKAVEEVALGANGFLDHMKKGAIWVDSTTVNPSFTLKMYEEAKKRGIRFADAPVLGSKAAAENRQLVVVVGADEKDFEEIKPLLEAIGKKVVRIGEVAMGSSFKIVVNLMLGISMLAYSEAVALGKSLGIKEEFLFELLPELPVAAPFLKAKKDKIKTGNYEAEFPLEHMQKDLYLAAEEAYNNNVPLPLVNTAKEIYMIAKKMGLSREDFSAIYKAITQK